MYRLAHKLLHRSSSAWQTPATNGVGATMNVYMILSAGRGSREATGLSERLSAWHDAMVAHERRLRAVPGRDVCSDECPHAEARTLWSEAVATFGADAADLAFLSSRAQQARRSASPVS